MNIAPYLAGDLQSIEFAQQVTVDDLRKWTHQSIDAMLKIIRPLDDADVVFEPEDPDADDPFATEGEERIGWSVAHIVAHVTASSEEGAALSSVLARGIVTAERPRYETPWRDFKTQQQVIQRLEESRRMRLAYLDTWPETPFLDVYREVSPRFTEHVGLMNAPAAFLFGLKHEFNHHEQIQEAARQAVAAKARA